MEYNDKNESRRLTVKWFVPVAEYLDANDVHLNEVTMKPMMMMMAIETSKEKIARSRISLDMFLINLYAFLN